MRRLGGTSGNISTPQRARFRKYFSMLLDEKMDILRPGLPTTGCMTGKAGQTTLGAMLLGGLGGAYVKASHAGCSLRAPLLGSRSSFTSSAVNRSSDRSYRDP
jgi:hypothetical protein